MKMLNSIQWFSICCLLAVVIFLPSIAMTQTAAQDSAPPTLWTPSDAPNTPLGTGKGIFPGRVTWARDTSAAPWDGTTGHWWEDGTGINQNTVDVMLSRSLEALTGAKKDAKAWNKLFQYFNRERGRGKAGYKPGEKIAVKINCNNAYAGYADEDNQIDASPQMLFALLTQLIREAGVPQEMISVYEATRVIPDRVFAKSHKAYPGVRFVDSKGDTANGRFPVEWQENVVRYSVENPCGKNIPKCLKEATYLINMSLLKGHPTTGATMTAKNHYGTVNARDHREYVNSWKHPMGIYHPFVDIIGSDEVGGKTVLYLIDGLYGIRDVNDDVAKYGHWEKLFNGEWLASLFLSQDPLAIDSAGLDFLNAEFPLGRENKPQAMINADNYLHEAALAYHPPSGTVYMPNGKLMKSLGVHEHWNNAADRKYSRNLGTGNGIELFVVGSK